MRVIFKNNIKTSLDTQICFDSAASVVSKIFQSHIFCYSEIFLRITWKCFYDNKTKCKIVECFYEKNRMQNWRYFSRKQNHWKFIKQSCRCDFFHYIGEKLPAITRVWKYFLHRKQEPFLKKFAVNSIAMILFNVIQKAFLCAT
jgi:hypothetical protein